MRLERIKTILLLFLVAVSGIFTYSLWVAGPGYDALPAWITPQAAIQVNEDISFKELMRPERVLIHLPDEEHYVLWLGDLWLDVQWDNLLSFSRNIESVEPVEMEPDEWHQLTRSQQAVEFVLPGEYPLAYVFPQLADAPELSIDRLVLVGDTETASIYARSLVSDKYYQVGLSKNYQVEIPTASPSWIPAIEASALWSSEYGDDIATGIYVPLVAHSKARYRFLDLSFDPQQTWSEDYSNWVSLFYDNLSIVRKMVGHSETLHTDGQRVLKLDKQTGRLSYSETFWYQDTPASENTSKNLVTFMQRHIKLGWENRWQLRIQHSKEQEDGSVSTWLKYYPGDAAAAQYFSNTQQQHPPIYALPVEVATPLMQATQAGQNVTSFEMLLSQGRLYQAAAISHEAEAAYKQLLDPPTVQDVGGISWPLPPRYQDVSRRFNQKLEEGFIIQDIYLGYYHYDMYQGKLTNELLSPHWVFVLGNDNEQCKFFVNAQNLNIPRQQ